MNNTVVGIVLGGASGGALIFADLIGLSAIGVKDALAAGVFACGLVWWLGRQFQKIEDRQHALREAIEEIRRHCRDCNGIKGGKVSDRSDD